jgi:heme-degrading monooxygenase HmoA
MEEEVKQAFLGRPRYVEWAAGFLGMETFTDAKDPAMFHLITRWTDVGSFQLWHGSKEHRLSHQFIPKGLKLDPKFTKLVVLDRISVADKLPDFENVVGDSYLSLSKYLQPGRNQGFPVWTDKA